MRLPWFCVPFLTQVFGVCFGLFALLRRRLPDERVGLAWVGLLFSIIAIFGWTIVLTLYAIRTPVTTTTIRTWPPPPPVPVLDDLMETSDLSDQMRRIHGAATAHHRDYRKWPDRVEPLVGRALPHGYTMSSKLTYRPVPASEEFSNTWVLIVSDPVDYSEEGEKLDRPHCLVLRLSGKIELLPERDIQQLLATQPTGG